MRGAPIRFEHHDTSVGEVVSNWVGGDGELKVLARVDAPGFAGTLAREALLRRERPFRELSLGTLNAMDTNTKQIVHKGVVELSVVRKGQRDGCTIDFVNEPIPRGGSICEPGTALPTTSTGGLAKPSFNNLRTSYTNPVADCHNTVLAAGAGNGSQATATATTLLIPQQCSSRFGMDETNQPQNPPSETPSGAPATPATPAAPAAGAPPGAEAPANQQQAMLDAGSEALAELQDRALASGALNGANEAALREIAHLRARLAEETKKTAHIAKKRASEVLAASEVLDRAIMENAEGLNIDPSRVAMLREALKGIADEGADPKAQELVTFAAQASDRHRQTAEELGTVKRSVEDVLTDNKRLKVENAEIAARCKKLEDCFMGGQELYRTNFSAHASRFAAAPLASAAAAVTSAMPKIPKSVAQPIAPASTMAAPAVPAATSDAAPKANAAPEINLTGFFGGKVNSNSVTMGAGMQALNPALWNEVQRTTRTFHGGTGTGMEVIRGDGYQRLFSRNFGAGEASM